MVLMYSPSTRSQKLSVQLLDVPPGWALHDIHVMGEAPAGKVEQTVGIAANYDALADSPAETGVFQHFDFQQDGATYHIVVHANPGDYDTAKLENILKRITHAEVDWMADRPFDSYTFLYHFPQGHGAGGMEHAYGTAIDLNAERLKSNMMPMAGVSAHEFFHLWNVKRIRPQSLEPIDYQHIMDTRALWFSEGLTSTVGDLMLSRAGLVGERQYLDRVASEMGELQSRPARRWQSVEESSLDAWFEGNAFYRTPERSISYYNKGEVVGVLLDLRIRQLSNGGKSLRDLFRWMNDNYAKKGLFFPDSDGVQQAAEAITGQSFAEFFRDYVAGVRELPYNDFFSFVGLQVAETTARYTTAGFTTSTNLGGQPEVATVEANSEAQRDGIVVGDRILELNGKPANQDLDFELSKMREGATVKLRVASRDTRAHRQAQTDGAPRAGICSAGYTRSVARAACPSRSLDPRRQRKRRCAVIRTIVMLTFWGVSTLIVGPVMMVHAFLTGNILPLYRVGMKLGITGVRVAGIKVEVRGLENLQPRAVTSSCRTTHPTSIRRSSSRTFPGAARCSSRKKSCACRFSARCSRWRRWCPSIATTAKRPSKAFTRQRRCCGAG